MGACVPAQVGVAVSAHAKHRERMVAPIVGGELRVPAPVVTDLPKMFLLDRRVDHSGLSGVGVVATGVVFPDGLTVARWRGCNSGVEQLEIFGTPDQLLAVHGHSGGTTIRWLPRPVPTSGA